MTVTEIADEVQSQILTAVQVVQVGNPDQVAQAREKGLAFPLGDNNLLWSRPVSNVIAAAATTESSNSGSLRSPG